MEHGKCTHAVSTLSLSLLAYGNDRTFDAHYLRRMVISSSIGGFLPEKCIWQFAMAIVCAPRVLQSVLIYKYYQSRPMLQNSLFRVCNLLKFLLANAELFFLLLLSFVTSTENYPVHEVGFVGFIIFSVLHMTIQLVLQYPLARVNAKANSAFSFKLKLVCLVGHAASFAAAMYCFFRHNDYCEPYMYSQFAFFEYVTIVFNIISHASALLEIGDTFIVFGVLDSAKHL
ncbi:hypothetical protein, variant [Capsaspora owczarzaki ATCC 30864]|uniref:CWH43-like N-terminal domain-containing protein n=1 Tax=Capsaspora owczarzaki (strain ATCC 30864) TaxID=595528 RepID=A0A0D2VRW6_CAPO3|nr:hypothetical protein, variant [Capsaspora owczarzaki ATCC 30864]